MEANATRLPARIDVPANRYTLRPPNQGGGALIIRSNVSISGDASGGTIIDAGSGCDTPNVSNGGVFRIERGDVTLGYLTIEGGNSQAGAGILVRGGNVKLEDVRIQDNFGITGGGGLAIDRSGIVSVRRTAITDNCARGAFGGGVWNTGLLSLQESLIARNTANRAGGIYNSGVLSLLSSTLSGNSALSPEAGTGGMYQGGFASLNNVTITRNTGVGNIPGSFRGGGIQIGSPLTTTVYNSIIAGNDGGVGPDDCVGTLNTNSRHDLIGNTEGCIFLGPIETFLLNVDPQLGPLADNGGPTQTHLPLATSPVREAGSPLAPGGALSACEVYDQRGIPRPQGNGVCDLGAVEVTTENAFVTRLVLVDADTNTDLFTLRNGDQLNRTTLPRNLSIRAEVENEAGSVVFGFDGNPTFQTENVPPYALGGDDPAGDYLPVDFADGPHTVTATPFSAAGGSGAAGGSLTMTFEMFTWPPGAAAP